MSWRGVSGADAGKAQTSQAMIAIANERSLLERRQSHFTVYAIVKHLNILIVDTLTRDI